MVLLVAAMLAQEPVRTDVFTAGADGYHTYRIPALLVGPRGALLAFCEGRKTGRGDHGDLDLVLRRSVDGGRTWEAMRLVYEEGGDAKVTIGNPCPVLDSETGTIWLPFTRDNNDVLVTSSADEGVTWSKPVVITAHVKKPGWTWYATGPGVGIRVERGAHRGRLVIPCDHREPLDGKAVTVSHAIFSDDHGATWALGENVAPHTNECQVAELADGSLLMNMRNYWGKDGGKPESGGKRAVATSADGGKTWGPLRFDAALVEPICQASLIRAQGTLLFSNPASTSKRERLTVRFSRDDGVTWPESRVLHEGPAAYSCLAALPDGRIGVLYERDDYRAITLATFPLDGK